MTSVQEKIQDAASLNSSLLTQLQETESAPAQLDQQVNYIKDLDSQIARSQKRVADLKRKTELELKDHKKYSESTFRRLAHKASGRKERFEEKAAKEEREYFDAIQAQKTAEDDLAYAKQLKAEAETQRDKFESQAKRHASLQRELDALYNSIFAGPTPGFPDEDAKEQSVSAAAQHCSSISQALERERHLIFLLKQAANKLQEARAHLADAHDASSWDMFGGGTMSSMAKRNSLERAESAISQVRMLQQQIHGVKPDIGDLGPMHIDSGSIWTDVVFDNVFTDMQMHDQIKQSEAQINRACQVLAQHVRDAEERERRTSRDLKQASDGLHKARKDLQTAREQAFTRVLSGEQIPQASTAPPTTGMRYPEAPPAYSA